MKHIMVDIETLSTAVNAAVLSASGAVEFDLCQVKAGILSRESDLSEQANRHLST